MNCSADKSVPALGFGRIWLGLVEILKNLVWFGQENMAQLHSNKEWERGVFLHLWAQITVCSASVLYYSCMKAWELTWFEEEENCWKGRAETSLNS